MNDLAKVRNYPKKCDCSPVNFSTFRWIFPHLRLDMEYISMAYEASSDLSPRPFSRRENGIFGGPKGSVPISVFPRVSRAFPQSTAEATAFGPVADRPVGANSEEADVAYFETPLRDPARRSRPRPVLNRRARSLDTQTSRCGLPHRLARLIAAAISGASEFAPDPGRSTSSSHRSASQVHRPAAQTGSCRAPC